MQSITIPELQARRTQRAARQADAYTFRLVRIAQTPAVYVISAASRQIYTVHSGRCNCPDYLRRCAGTTLQCKHILLADRWMSGQEPDCRCGETVPAAEAQVCSHAKLPATCSYCRESDRKPYLAQRPAVETDADRRVRVARNMARDFPADD